jgi:hypothetical protein
MKLEAGMTSDETTGRGDQQKKEDAATQDEITLEDLEVREADADGVVGGLGGAFRTQL